MTKEEILKKTEKYVRDNVPSSRKPDNRYFNHVFGARKFATKLCEDLGANFFVVDMAILLHDIGADAGAVHADKSAKMAAEYLSQYVISKNDLEKIVSAIKNHSMGSPANNIEDQIIQDADGLIFLEDTYEDFYTYHKNDRIKDFSQKMLAKIEGMFKKIKTQEGLKIAGPLFLKAKKDIVEWTS